MAHTDYKTALIVGAGSGLSASLARLLAKSSLKVALAARATDKLKALAQETGAKVFAADSSKRADVAALFAAVAEPQSQNVQANGQPRLVSRMAAITWPP